MRHIMLAAAAAVTAALPAIADVAPGDVVYVDGAVEASLTGVAGDAASGAKVVTTRSQGNCVACHQIDALPQADFQGNIGPALDGAGSRWTEAQLRGLISNAKMTFDGTFMPAFYKTSGFTRPGDAYTGKAAPENLPPVLTAQQVEDVVAFLLTLKD